VFRAAVGRRIPLPEKRVISNDSVAIAATRENFGDVPMALSHRGRRSLSDPSFARLRRRCADGGSEPDVELGDRLAGGRRTSSGPGLDGLDVGRALVGQAAVDPDRECPA